MTKDKIDMAVSTVSVTSIETINITGFKNSNADDIKEFFNIESFDSTQDGYNKAIQRVKELTTDRKMELDRKLRFQRAFPAILTSISIHFELPVSLHNFVAEYMSILDSTSPIQRDKNPLIGNETGHLYKMLEENGNYPPSFNIERGTFKFPNQWFSAFCIISNNIPTLEILKKQI